MNSSVSDEMMAIVRGAAAPVCPGDTVGALMRRAARRLGLSPRRVRAYWYGEVKRVPAEEADRLRAARETILRGHAAQLVQALSECNVDPSDLDAFVRDLAAAQKAKDASNA
ncbi:hypothetical protein FE249_00880 [Acidiphilium multivorum]|uniref:hypothetical protein n=1 Tax=Acidiphilium multivorum TaxID=62140 RepID=UPI001F4C238C|nr:hypothetical protein [Acidiphilium multivorum]UNC12882.1 hypothetical protein FE249_00880 [Acidiphilium multivorum]